jgi:acyl CoA:acetate/3-ketoacid CoA transferase
MNVHGDIGPRVLSAADAVQFVRDGATLAIECSGGGVVEPSALISALALRHETEGAPAGLTTIFCSGVGNRAGSGMDLLADPHLVQRTIGGHYAMSPHLAELAAAGMIQAYNLPQGVISQLFRERAAGRPGVLTQVGIGTFCDPRLGGGKLNDRCRDDFVSVVDIAGGEWLLYTAPPIDVAFIRATTADEAGNLSLEHEPANLGVLAAAMATRNSGGTVIAQVERIARRGTLPARSILVPGHLVDVLVVEPLQTQTSDPAPYNPSLSGELRVPLAKLPPLPLDERKVVARRARREIRPGSVVNLGVGIADGIGLVAAEEGTLDECVFTVEQGLAGGVPARGVIFGSVWNPESIIDTPSQFDFYDGGGLDIACLGFAEVDAAGNVNSSRVGGAIFGTGGFINISQGAKEIVFCGTFTAGGLRTSISDGTLRVDREGRNCKFVRSVGHLTFSAEQARKRGHRVMYVTERAVFELGQNGLELTEIAPGIDLQRDIVAHMEFEPALRAPLQSMDATIFKE